MSHLRGRFYGGVPFSLYMIGPFVSSVFDVMSFLLLFYVIKQPLSVSRLSSCVGVLSAPRKCCVLLL